MSDYYKKYLKYKQKYLQLKGGATQGEFDARFENSTGESLSRTCPDSYYNFPFNENIIMKYCEKSKFKLREYNSNCMPQILSDLENFKKGNDSNFAKFLKFYQNKL